MMGKALLKRRGEVLERSFAHVYDTGGMRRVHLRVKDNIAKRALIQGAAFNLSLILRQIIGVGTARQAADLQIKTCLAVLWLLAGLREPIRRVEVLRPTSTLAGKGRRCGHASRRFAILSTGCFGREPSANVQDLNFQRER
jgi:hypothetical protein